MPDIFNKSRTYTDAFASAVTGSMRRICLFLETVCRNKFWLDTGQVGAGKVGPWQAWDEQAGAGQVDAGATAGRQGVDRLNPGPGLAGRGWTVGWSDLALFCDFRKATLFC